MRLRPLERSSIHTCVTTISAPEPSSLPRLLPPPPTLWPPGRQFGTEKPAQPQYRPLSPKREAPVAQNVRRLLLISGYQRIAQLAQNLEATQWLEEFVDIDPNHWAEQADALTFLLDEIIMPQASFERLEVLDWADECKAILRLLLPPAIDVQKYLADSRQRSADAIALEETCVLAQDVAGVVFGGLQHIETKLDRMQDQSVNEVREGIDQLRQRRAELNQQVLEEITPLILAADQMHEQTEASLRFGMAMGARAEELKQEIDSLARESQDLVREHL